MPKAESSRAVQETESAMVRGNNVDAPKSTQQANRTEDDATSSVEHRPANPPEEDCVQSRPGNGLVPRIQRQQENT